LNLPPHFPLFQGTANTSTKKKGGRKGKKKNGCNNHSAPRGPLPHILSKRGGKEQGGKEGRGKRRIERREKKVGVHWISSLSRPLLPAR